MSAVIKTLKHINPAEVKPGVVKVTFESDDGLRKAIVLVKHNYDKQELSFRFNEFNPNLMERDKHEPYMLLALSFVGSLFPPEK